MPATSASAVWLAAARERMTTTDARNRLKSRLDIPVADTTFDDVLDEYLLDAVNRLYPLSMRQLAVEEVAALPDEKGQQWLDLTTLSPAPDEVRSVLIDDEYEVDSIHQHGTQLRVRGISVDATTLYVYGLAYHDLVNLPVWLELCVFYFAQSEFYNFLIGNKRKYNVYMQNGGQAVDNMRDLADDFEQRGVLYLEEKAQLYGR